MEGRPIMTSAGLNEMLARLLRGEWGGPNSDAIDWDAVVQGALTQRVAPLIFHVLRQGDHWDQVPQPAARRLQMAYRQTRAENRLRVDALRDTLMRLAGVGIRVAPLKGAALGQWIYKDAAVRPMTDLDVLVPPQQAGHAIDVLLQAGYRRMVTELRPGFDLQFRGELELQFPGPVPYCIELHWRLIDMHWVDRHVDYAALWERAEPASWSGEDAYRLGIEDWLLHQAAHAVYKHRKLTLLDLCDVDQLVRNAGSALDWERLSQIGRDTGWLSALTQVLVPAKSFLGTKVPPSFLRCTPSHSQPPSDRWLMQAWLSGRLPDIAYPLLDWLTLPNMKARLRHMAAYLFPSHAFLRSCYPQASRWPIGALHARRWWDRATGLLSRGHTWPLEDD